MIQPNHNTFLSFHDNGYYFTKSLVSLYSFLVIYLAPLASLRKESLPIKLIELIS